MNGHCTPNIDIVVSVIRIPFILACSTFYLDFLWVLCTESSVAEKKRHSIKLSWHCKRDIKGVDYIISSIIRANYLTSIYLFYLDKVSFQCNKCFKFKLKRLQSIYSSGL